MALRGNQRHYDLCIVFRDIHAARSAYKSMLVWMDRTGCARPKYVFSKVSSRGYALTVRVLERHRAEMDLFLSQDYIVEEVLPHVE